MDLGLDLLNRPTRFGNERPTEIAVAAIMVLTTAELNLPCRDHNAFQ